MYEELDDAALEARIRELGYEKESAELMVELSPAGQWVAALRQFSPELGGIFPEGAVVVSFESPDRRTALENLLAALEGEEKFER